MKPLAQWFEEYGESHQNKTNKKIHYFCVPAIFFSICGLIMSIPTNALQSLFPSGNPLLVNWLLPILLLVLIFYFRLSLVMGIKMLLFSAFCIVGNHLIGQQVTLWVFSLILFAVGWIGQFYGHHLEGKKPSFIKDLQFLLIGPAWVIQNLIPTK